MACFTGLPEWRAPRHSILGDRSAPMVSNPKVRGSPFQATGAKHDRLRVR